MFYQHVREDLLAFVFLCQKKKRDVDRIDLRFFVTKLRKRYIVFE